MSGRVLSALAAAVVPFCAPGETRDVADRQPTGLSRLRRLLALWQSQTRATRP